MRNVVYLSYYSDRPGDTGIPHDQPVLLHADKVVMYRVQRDVDGGRYLTHARRVVFGCLEELDELDHLVPGGLSLPVCPQISII